MYKVCVCCEWVDWVHDHVVIDVCALPGICYILSFLLQLLLNFLQLIELHKWYHYSILSLCQIDTQHWCLLQS